MRDVTLEEYASYMKSYEESIEYCPHSKDDRGHCRCWWECETCCWCRSNGAEFGSNEEPDPEEENDG